MRAIAGVPLLFCAVTALLGCQRKLPGPVECRAFALASLNLPLELPASELERVRPRLAAEAELRTRACLTTPWDGAMMDCLQSGRSEHVCLAGLNQRRSLSDGLQ